MTGQCRPCLASGVKLLNSHLIPAALYKVVRDERVDVVHPWVITTDVTIQSPRQVSDYLLCAECERRLEQGGESWFIPQCWRNPTTFPLRACLVEAQPIPKMEAGVAIYEGARILDLDVDRLAYFAVSIFWRAAAHQWAFHKETVRRLKLAAYQERLRQYLLGGSFPADAVLVVLVAYGMEEMRNGSISFPHLSKRDKGWRRYSFTVPGVTFWLFVGRAIPSEIQRMCCVRSPQKLLFSSDQVDLANAQMQRAVFARSQDFGELGGTRPTDVELQSPWSRDEVMKFVPRDPSKVRILKRRPKR
jgi:hypothetical protein